METLPLLDPDAELRETSRLLRSAHDRWRGRRAEVYLRSSRRLRVTRGTGGAPPRIDRGLERGLAARVRDDSRGTTGFAAASGGGDDLARWAFESAATGRVSSAAAPIADGAAGASAFDRAVDLAAPSSEELSDWLFTSQERLERASAPGAARLQVEWVEAGSTVESLVTDHGFRSSRARRRVWAMAVSRRQDLADAPGRPRILAGTSLQALDVNSWVAEQLQSPGTARLGARPSPGVVVIEPGAAALVVGFLVQALHGAGAPLFAPVGPGWKLADDPVAPDALFGGAFDDAGFPARRVELADGIVVRGILDGRGHYRRPSFRDPPEAMATQLILEPGELQLPPDGYFVHDVRIVPLDAEGCILWIDGTCRRRGRPAEVFMGARLRTSPVDLVGRVAAVAGPAVRTAAGVTTPHLVLEGLTLEM